MRVGVEARVRDDSGKVVREILSCGHVLQANDSTRRAPNATVRLCSQCPASKQRVGGTRAFIKAIKAG